MYYKGSGISFATKNPHLVVEWSDRNVLSPHEVAYASNKNFWFKCGRGHEWETTPSNRSSGKNCPYCTGVKVCLDTCLASTHPHLAAEWYPTKNGDLTPSDVTYGSDRKCWWKCPKGFDHEWSATIGSRVRGNGCACCGGKKVCHDNCLQTLFPDVAAEWHPTKNGDLTPSDVIARSNKKHWFLCKCGHEWKTSLKDRCGKDTGCPVCNESHGEKRIRKVLTKLGIRYKREARFSGCKSQRSLPFDFIIFPSGKDPGAIEYHGTQHYVQHRKWTGASTLAKVQARDAIKRQFCLDKKLCLLEISYMNYDRIEELIKEFIELLPPIRKGLVLRY
jgi:Probable Zinc-ribbon domain